jgi:hypothetical protein
MGKLGLTIGQYSTLHKITREDEQNPRDIPPIPRYCLWDWKWLVCEVIFLLGRVNKVLGIWVFGPEFKAQQQEKDRLAK